MISKVLYLTDENKNFKNNLKYDQIDLKKIRLEDNEILFKTIACGVCNTDIMKILSSKKTSLDDKILNRKKGKKYLGHEVIGKAIRIGRKVPKNFLNRKFTIGEFNVCKAFNISPNCNNCKKNIGVHCSKKNFRKYKKEVYGGYSDFFVRSKFQAIILPKNIKDINAIFIEPLASVINLANRINKQKILFIFGLSTLSVLFYRYCKLRFKNKKFFFIVDNKLQKEQCKKLKIMNSLTYEECISKKQLINCIINFKGNLSFLQNHLMKNIMDFSTIFQFGLGKDNINLQMNLLVQRGITIKSVHGYSSKKIFKKKNIYLSDFHEAIKIISKYKNLTNGIIYQIKKLANARDVLINICDAIKKGYSKKIIFRTIFTQVKLNEK